MALLHHKDSGKKAAKADRAGHTKTAIITGASSGIGQAIGEALSEAGWKWVGLTSKDCDLSDLEQTLKVAKDLRKHYPVIDALIHVAGIYHDKEAAFVNRDLEDYDPAWIAATMNVGVTGFMLLAARLLPNIPKEGYVIGISQTFEKGANGWLPYYTSKRALEDFLVGLAEDYKSGPNVFGISPSHTNTPAFDKFFPAEAKTAQPADTIGLLVEHLVTGWSRYKSGDIIAVKHRKAGKAFHA